MGLLGGTHGWVGAALMGEEEGGGDLWRGVLGCLLAFKGLLWGCWGGGWHLWPLWLQGAPMGAVDMGSTHGFPTWDDVGGGHLWVPRGCCGCRQHP